ncbi:unnamed protein product [Lota lota]
MSGSSSIVMVEEMVVEEMVEEVVVEEMVVEEMVEEVVEEVVVVVEDVVEVAERNNRKLMAANSCPGGAGIKETRDRMLRPRGPRGGGPRPPPSSNVNQRLMGAFHQTHVTMAPTDGTLLWSCLLIGGEQVLSREQLVRDDISPGPWALNTQQQHTQRASQSRASSHTTATPVQHGLRSTHETRQTGVTVDL